MTFEANDTISDIWETSVSDFVRDPARYQHALSGRSLSILADLGMTDAQIARYFSVPESRVMSLRRYYGMA